MGLENNTPPNKTPPRRGGELAFKSGAMGESNRPRHSTAEATEVTRPKKLVVLHWLTVLCVACAATLIWIRDQVDGRTMQRWLLEGHRHFGLFVLFLFVARVAIRLRLGKLPHAGKVLGITRIAAGLTHIALYAVLLALPLIGWALSNAEGKPVHLFGLTLPALVGADEDLGDALLVWHQDIAWLLLGLVLLHVGAALWHHFVLRDGVLRTMLPKRRR
jgi:cytochrome b561